MVDTVNVTRQMERNADLGISDFYLVEDQEGKVDFTGTMDLARVLEIVKAKVLEQKSGLTKLILYQYVVRTDRDFTKYVKWWNSII